MKLEDLIVFLNFYVENFENIFLNQTELNYSNIDVFHMKSRQKNPEYKQNLTYFGEDCERKHQGQLFEEKVKQAPYYMAEQHLIREELIVSYTPEANPHDFINMMKEKLGINTSPGSNTEKSIYNSIKYKNTINQNPAKFREYVGYHWENSLRNSIKGTPDESTDHQFSAPIQDFSCDFDARNRKRSSSPKKN